MIWTKGGKKAFEREEMTSVHDNYSVRAASIGNVAFAVGL